MSNCRNIWVLLALLYFVLTISSCSQGEPIIYVTATEATSSGKATLPNPFHSTSTPSSPTATPLQPTPNLPYPTAALTTGYAVQPGDTLTNIAQSYGTSVEQIVALNSGMAESAVLSPIEVIVLPGRPSKTTSNTKILPDSELVNSPAASKFDVAAYIRFQPGFIRVYSENVLGRMMSSADIVQFVATSTSVNPRLLLALLEYRGGWVSNPVPSPDAITYPMGWKNSNQQGLFRQLFWTANLLNAGYYGWKYRGMNSLKFSDNTWMTFASGLNPGSVAVQYFLSQTSSYATWKEDVKPSGFFTTYMAMFGDPFQKAIEPLVPSDLKQPTFRLPFNQGEMWYYTSGPHGGWDNNSGWSAVDFAPPAPSDDVIAAQGKGHCFVASVYATAVVSGLVVRSGDGIVVIDVDMDGDERTGWTVLYFHIAAQDSVKAGTIVQAGTPIGHPSCEGFYLNAPATHLHLARRYNGEWLTADCWACAPSVANPPFVLSGWTVKGDPNQVYQGRLEKDTAIRRAEQGRDTPDNQILW